MRTGSVSDYASAYTLSFVMVQWQDDAGKVSSNWFAAADMQRVDLDDWHSIPANVLDRDCNGPRLRDEAGRKGPASD